MSVVIASRCACGGCDAACKYRGFKPCCGACMDDTPFRQKDIIWPLPGVTEQEGEAG